MKKIYRCFLAAVMAASVLTILLGINGTAATATVEFCTLNTGGDSGFVDNNPSGQLEVAVLDGKNVLKFSSDASASSSSSAVAIEGLNFSKLGITYDTYRYMSIQYKYASNNPVYKGAFTVQLCNSNKVFAASGGAVSGSALNASGEWETAYFDLTDMVDGRLSESMEQHTINHIQLRPFGGTAGKTLDANDVLYIGTITFSEENLDPNGTTKEAPTAGSSPSTGLNAGSSEKTQITQTPTSTETPESLGGLTTGAEPKYVGAGSVIVDAATLISGIVDSKDTGTFEKVTADGRNLVKFTPNPNGGDSSITPKLEAVNLSGKLPSAVTYEDYSFISVEYFYAAKSPSYNGNLAIYLANSNKIFQSSGSDILSDSAMVAGEWAIAYFQIDKVKATLKTDMTEHILNHIHIKPFGSTAVKNLGDSEAVYIGKIGFYKENPNPRTEYKVSFTKNGVGIKGTDVEGFTVKLGETITLPECSWSFEGSQFVGWEFGGTTYKIGDTLTAEGDYDFVFNAVWKESGNLESVKCFMYENVYGGVVVDCGTALSGEKVTEDGISAVVAKPDPDYVDADGKPSWMRFENISLAQKINIDLDAYKYVTITYKYSSPNPLTDVVKVPLITLTRNSGMFNTTGIAFTAIENTEIRANEWTTVLYEIPDLTDKYTDPNANHILQQMHIQPYGSVTNNKLTADDLLYIQGITFHIEKPDVSTVRVPYITGFENGSFGVGQTMTRAQSCTVIARLVAGSESNISAGVSSFADVAADAWYTKYIAYCESKGLLSAYSGTFSPDKAITRAEFVELVYNIGLLTDKGLNGKFTDVSADYPRADVIAAAGKAGLVNGYDNGDGTYSFKPDNTISREEVVTVINNAYGRKSNSEELVKYGFDGYFTDVEKTHWAFAAITDAAVMHFAYRESEGETDLWLYYSNASILTEDNYKAAQKKLVEVDLLTAKRIEEIRSTETTVNVIGTKYYFANDGDDANDGLSPEKPKKTLAAISALNLKSGDGVFFKRGDVFRGSISAKNGVTYSAYGDGAKPELYASPQNYAGAENWEQTSVENVWKLKIPVTNDVGLAVFNNGEAWSEKRIKGRSDFVDGKLEDLDKDLTLWHDIVAPMGVSGYVYLRSDKGNPGERFNSIELNVREHIMLVSANDVTIDNICFKYTGAHAISSGNVSNLTVQNCEFGWIGGSWFRTDILSRYGNAVEIYGACDGYIVDNCYIYQVYDAGVTHQLTKSPSTVCVMADIHYTNNVITDTTYPIEYFINQPDSGVSHVISGCEISGNIIRNTGFGFGDQRPDNTQSAGIKSWNTYNAAEDYVINNNIFDRAKYALIEIGADASAWLPEMNGNVYIQYEKYYFGNIGSINAVANAALSSYVEGNSGDENAEVYVLPAID